jgi:hypothetical protein
MHHMSGVTAQIDVRFYAGRNSLLAPWRRGHAPPYSFSVSGSIKDMVEALAVPPTEIGIDIIRTRAKQLD